MKNVLGRVLKNRDWFLFGLAVLIGVSLCISENLTYDETYSVAMAELKITDIIETTAKDVHPPLYYIFLHVFMSILHTDAPQAAKAFSFIFYLGYLLLAKFAIKKYLTKEEHTFFLFLSVVFPAMIVNACNARMYSFALFWTVAVGVLAIDFCREKNSMGRNCGLIICSLLAMYSHSFAMLGIFLIYLILLLTILCRKDRKRFIRFGVIGVIVAAGYLPWLSTLLRQVSVHKDQNAPFTWKTVWMIISEWFSTWHTPSVISNCLGICVVCGLCVAGIIACVYRKKMLLLVSSLPFFMLALVGVMMSVMYTPCFWGRYAFSLIWCLFILMAVGYGLLSRRGKTISVAMALVMFVLTYRNELTLEFSGGGRTMA